jgi:23S rRNA pseudouridine1911/1915/1917 synthase
LKNIEINESTSLFEVLKEMYPNSSANTLRKMLKNKRVSVNKETVVQANYQVNKKMQIRVGTAPRAISHGIHVVYEDKNIIVINKPGGLLSVPLDTGSEANALEAIRDYYPSSRIFPVHRIDKDTSGILIFARGKTSTKLLNEMFKKHNLRRVYIAVVLGNLSSDKGTWKSKLIEGKDYLVHSTRIPDQGQLAITHFSVMKRSKKYSFLKLILQTGKKHQIRVHCREAGHPIVGDKKYGSREGSPVSRMCLHSHHIEFINPFTKKKMSFSAPAPSQFAKLAPQKK